MTKRRMKGGALLLAISAACVAVPAGAQNTPTPAYQPPARGTLNSESTRANNRLDAVMRPDMDTAQSIQAYQRLLIFANCSVRSSAGTMTEALAAPPRSSAEDARFGRLQERLAGCPSNPIGILSLERGAFSEAMYRAMAPASIDEKAITAKSADTMKFIEAEDTWNKLREPNDRAMIEATNCLVAVQPGIANRLLLTAHGSAEEKAALNDLFAKAPDCAGATRPKNISSAFLRAFVADSTYRLSVSDVGSKFFPGLRTASVK